MFVTTVGDLPILQNHMSPKRAPITRTLNTAPTALQVQRSLNWLIVKDWISKAIASRCAATEFATPSTVIATKAKSGYKVNEPSPPAIFG